MNTKRVSVVAVAVLLGTAGTAVATGVIDLGLAPIDDVQPVSGARLLIPPGGSTVDPTPPEGDQFDREQALATVEPAIAILRRGANASSNESKFVRRVKTAQGAPVTVSVTGYGLCIQPSFGGTGCGDPAEAATQPPIKGIASSNDEYVAGVVPDDVASIVVSTTRETITTPVRDNVFEVHVLGNLTKLSWQKRDGSIEVKLPHSK